MNYKLTTKQKTGGYQNIHSKGSGPCAYRFH